MKQEIFYPKEPGLFSSPPPVWPDFEEINIIGKRYSLRLLREEKSEFKAYADLWKKAYPSLYGGMVNFFLYPHNYPRLFGEKELFQKNLFAAFIFQDNKAKKIFGGAILLLDIPNRSAQGVIMAVLPEYRKKVSTGKFLYKFIENYDRFIEKSGAEYAWVGAVTTHTTTQKLLKHVNYKVRGIIPGMSLTAINKKNYLRENYVYMDKFYNRGEKKKAQKMKLIPEAEKLWNSIALRAGEE